MTNTHSQNLSKHETVCHLSYRTHH